ncbi:glycine betaine ABC transporter substrate-binding protein [Desemzia sp. FAM 23989]|uniref:glycine betaine ABC transporter substrate-binding protein n=1 Tax=Desemzia sp. FAM 23989 TaxID=3259523 RepID=UPI00388E2B34
MNWKRLGLTATLGTTLLLAACSSGDETAQEDTVGKGEEIELSYVAWDTEIASTNVIGKVLEDLGYDVELTQLDNAIMWESVASGEADAMVAAWLPGTHGAQFEEYGDQMVDLGPNLEGAAIGLVVPSYMDVDSIADLTDEADMTITGIEPGAGVVAAAQQAVEDYDNLEGWTVQTSSSGAMTTTLGQAYENEEDIVVTGWSPHWKFQSYDLKYLEDPQGTFGEAETINTMARDGLEEDMPEAYQVLDQFEWTTADMEAIMLDIQEGTDPEDAAATWVEENQDKVAEWTEGVTAE